MKEEFLEKEVEDFEILEEDEQEKKSEKLNSRVRCWVGTWNNPSMTDQEFEEHFENLLSEEKLQYAVFQREKGEENGKIHFQFFVNFKTPQYFTTLKTKLLPYGCHFKPMRSTAERCKQYCSKVDTRVSGPYEIGEFMEERQRTDLKKAQQMIEEGIPYNVVYKIFPTQCLMYSRQLKEREREVLKESQRNVFRKLNVSYIYGAPGTGKTRSIMEHYGYDKVYRVKFYDKRAFDAYNNEKVILFDEFRSSFKITDMLHYLDGYPLELPCRYNDKVASYTEVFIVSNIPLYEQYKNVQEEEPITYDAFKRRIHNIVKFDSKGHHILQSRNSAEQIKLEELPVEQEVDLPWDD